MESTLYLLNPLIPWPVDHIKTATNTAHLPLRALVDQYGWEEARKHPEVRRLLKVMGEILSHNTSLIRKVFAL